MKIKLFHALLFVVGFAATSMAQSISFGPRVGATFSKINYEDAYYYDNDVERDLNDGVKSLSGFQIGAVANVTVSDLFSVQYEFLFIQKGMKRDEYNNTKYNYLEVPALAKLTFGTEQLHGFVTGGPTASYLMSGNYKRKVDGNESSGDIEFADVYNRFELGASFGIGLGYKLGAGTLNFDVRYGLGLTSLIKNEYSNSKAKNRVLGVSLAYLFSLKPIV
jgi:hypothetical protein